VNGKTVVITGAGGGIGRAIALAFGRAGADLVLGDAAADVETTADEARRAGARVEALRGDVTRSEDTQALARRAVDAFGRLDVLVTCAGIDGGGLLSEQDEAA
jgi:3-oxoacyl-[acyl-carrier protein] reductase